MSHNNITAQLRNGQKMGPLCSTVHVCKIPPSKLQDFFSSFQWYFFSPPPGGKDTWGGDKIDSLEWRRVDPILKWETFVKHDRV